MSLLEQFCEIINISEKVKLEQAISFIWFHLKTTTENEIDIKTINSYFEKVNLSLYNSTLLKKELIKSKKVIKGSNSQTFKLSRVTLQELEKLAGNLFQQEQISIKEKATLKDTPYLNDVDIENAHKMAEIYIIIHCYENSVRRLIEDVLSNSLGINWWDLAASPDMKRKFTERQTKEVKNKWLSNRGTTLPLYYLDWTDLVKIIRKYPLEFETKIHDLKFVELRFEELEKIRNIIAHNGLLPADDDFQRVILFFNDWCKQIN
jgi:hypothetical protein